MNSLVFGIALAALFSTTSLLVVLLRISPLLSPEQALPAFLFSLFLSISSVCALAFLGIWKLVPIHTWDTGKVTSVSLRQGVFIGLGTIILIVFHMFSLLNWWIGLLIYAVFLLIELALES